MKREIFNKKKLKIQNLRILNIIKNRDLLKIF